MYQFFVDYGLVLELLLSFGLFTMSLERRSFFGLRVLADVAFLSLFCFLRKVIPSDHLYLQIIKYLFLYAGSWLMIYFTYNVSLRSSLYYLVGAAIAQHIGYALGDMTRELLTAYTGISPWWNGVIYGGLYILINIGLYFAFAYRINPKDSERINNGIIFALSGIMLVICIVILQFFEYYKESITEPLLILFTLMDVTCCLATMLIRWVAYLSIRSVVETEMVKQRLHQYSSMQSVIETMNIRLHDLKHQIHQLEKDNLVDPEVLKDVNDTITKYRSFARVGNDTLDTILTEKHIVCEKNKIRFTYLIDGHLIDLFSVQDINSVFGNAFDNAIEYLLSVPEEKRFLSIRSSVIGDLAKISVENYYEGTPSFNKDGLMNTTKGNTLYHGFGLRSIRSTIKKYHGNMTITVENSTFKLQFLLPMEKEETYTVDIGK